MKKQSAFLAVATALALMQFCAASSRPEWADRTEQAIHKQFSQNATVRITSDFKMKIELIDSPWLEFSHSERHTRARMVAVVAVKESNASEIAEVIVVYSQSRTYLFLPYNSETESFSFKSIELNRKASPANTPINGCFQDYAAKLSKETKGKTDLICESLLREVGVSIALVTVPSLGSITVESFAKQLLDNWSKEKVAAPRIVILLALNDRLMCIQPNDQAARLLSDATAREIIEQRFLPDFKRGQLDLGTVSGLEAIREKLQKH